MLSTTGITYLVTKKELLSKVDEKLRVINHLKIERINALFDEVDDLVTSLHNDAFVYDKIDQLLKLGKEDSTFRQRQEIVRDLRELIIYRDEPSIIHNVKILSLNGEDLVVEKDFAQTAYETQFRNPSNQFFDKAHHHMVYSSVTFDEAVDEYVMYAMAPLHKNKKVEALFLVELHMAPIYKAIADTTGLGNTGETVLTALDQNMIHIISPLKTDQKNFSLKFYQPDDQFALPAIKSLTNENGFDTKLYDYSNTLVDASWNYMPRYGWGIYSKINHKESFRSVFMLKRQLLLIALALTVFSVFSVLLLTHGLLKPIWKIRRGMERIAEGDFPEEIHYGNQDELSSTIDSMNSLVTRLKRSARLAMAIGEGKVKDSYNFEKNSDVLSRSLIKMKDNLAKLEFDNEKRKWTSEGIAIHTEVIRNISDDFMNMTQNFISTLTHYLEAQYGGLYMVYDDFEESLNSSDKDTNHVFYALIASHAYATESKQRLKFKLGQGLVGQCALSQEVVQVNDFDLVFSKIQSGLGESKKGSVLLVPLMVNEETLGVIEVTSFKVLKDYQVDFVKKVGENIASSMLAAKSAENTERLLKQSKLVVQNLKSKQKQLIETQRSQKIKEGELKEDNRILLSQIEELKRELRA